MKNLTRFSIFPLTLFCAAVLLSGCIFSMGSLVQLMMDSTLEPNTSLLPADHGLPDTIAGYRILAVKTSETTLCTPPGMAHLIVQVDAPTVQEAMLTDAHGLLRELERLDLNSVVRWRVEVVGPRATFEGIVAGNDRLNAFFVEHGCIEGLGGPVSRDLPDETEVP